MVSNWNELVKRSFSKQRRKNVTIVLLLVATVHFILLIIGFMYVKKSLVTAYHESSQSIRQLNINYSVDIKLQKKDHGLLEQQRKDKITKSGKSKTILLWNIPKAVSYPKFLDWNRCGRCDIINDKQQTNQSDAVVIHYQHVTGINDLPPPNTRNEDQVYVWTCRESPNTTKEIYKLDLTQLNDVINWTMTHRLDSDVFYPYAEILHRMYDERHGDTNDSAVVESTTGYVDLFYKSVDEVMASKRYLAAWVVGNCDGTKGAKARMQLVKLLTEAGLDIHKFGRCFPGHDFPPYRSEEAHAKLIQYKFYLAFENTFKCRDYVTYKFWKNSIYSGAVPIVWGAAKSDLERLAPRHSFIHMEDFPTLEDLVKYVKYLDSNDTAYREYFRWRDDENRGNKMAEDVPAEQTKGSLETDVLAAKNTDWIFSLSEAFGYCKLCRMLHKKDLGEIGKKSIRSLSNWWYGRERQECVSR